jgi:hypothetical protein
MPTTRGDLRGHTELLSATEIDMCDLEAVLSKRYLVLTADDADNV